MLLTEGAQQVAAASNQLSSSAEQLSQGSAEQASSIEEIHPPSRSFFDAATKYRQYQTSGRAIGTG